MSGGSEMSGQSGEGTARSRVCGRLRRSGGEEKKNARFCRGVHLRV